MLVAFDLDSCRYSFLSITALVDDVEACLLSSSLLVPVYKGGNLTASTGESNKLARKLRKVDGVKFLPFEALGTFSR